MDLFNAVTVGREHSFPSKTLQGSRSTVNFSEGAAYVAMNPVENRSSVGLQYVDGPMCTNAKFDQREGGDDTCTKPNGPSTAEVSKSHCKPQVDYETRIAETVPNEVGGESKSSNGNAKQCSKTVLQMTNPPLKEVQRPLFGKATDNPLPKYVRGRLIGHGAYGEAWLCRGTDTGELAVVKTMRLSGMSEKQLRYAQSEIRCLANAQHPNIVEFYGSQCDNDLLTIAMEFADAGDLRHHIKERYRLGQHYLTESEAMFLFVQIAMAIHHIHSRSMLHRDVKSANVLVMSNGLVKIADFGFSRQYEDTVSGLVASTFCGTPYYLAPELWQNSRYSGKAEVWSVGVLLYEMLALQRPFQSSTLRGLHDIIISGKYPPLPAQYSSEIRSLLATLLDVDAARRPTMLEMFCIPYVQEQLAVLRHLVRENNQISPQVRAQWEHEAAALVAKAQSSPPFATNGQDQRPYPGIVNVEVTYAGPVKKLCMLPVVTWQDRFLILTRGQLLLCESADSEEHKGTLNIDDLQSVCIIPRDVVDRPSVFALHTKDSKCTWLQAESNAQRVMWIRRLQHAMGVL